MNLYLNSWALAAVIVAVRPLTACVVYLYQTRARKRRQRNLFQSDSRAGSAHNPQLKDK